MDNRGGEGVGAAEREEESIEYQLLRAYCDKRTGQRSPGYHGTRMFAQGPVIYEETVLHGPQPSHQTVAVKKKRPAAPHLVLSEDSPKAVSDRISGIQDSLVQLADFTHIPNDDLELGSGAVGGVVNRLAYIADSVQTFDVGWDTDGPENQEDVVQKLVELLKKYGDELNEQIKDDKIFKQELLSTFSYALFEKVTSTTAQNLAGPGHATGRAAASEERLQREQIAWVFEVTSRLSSLDVIPKRRALSYGERYVRTHHSAWVEEQGGWESVFDDEDID